MEQSLNKAGFALDYNIWEMVMRGDLEYPVFVEEPGHAAKHWFLDKMARLAERTFDLANVEDGYDDSQKICYVQFTLDGIVHRINFTDERYGLKVPDRKSINSFFTDLNNILLDSGQRSLFVLINPKEYELRIALLPIAKIIELEGSRLLVSTYDFDRLRVLSNAEAIPNSFISFPDIDEIVPPKRQFESDAERVPFASDYVVLLKEILAQWNEEALKFGEIECIELGEDTPREKRRRLILHQNYQTWESYLCGDTDWVDTKELTQILNQVLVDSASDKQIVEIHTDDQSFRLALVTDSEAEKLSSYHYKEKYD
jgi:hypothetical protein